MIVGWYVHHHGEGHASRLRATLPHLAGVVVLSSLDAATPLDCACVRLPLDLDEAPRDPTANGTLHWVPRRHRGLAARMAAISEWIASAQPDVVVVDVSVEVALLARLHGCPVVLIAQRGRRSDPPHVLAYTQADAIVAPWTPATHFTDDGLPGSKTHFVGAISRFDALEAPLARCDVGGDVLVLLGTGGHEIDAAAVRAAASATPERTWQVAGPLSVTGPNVVTHGPAADVASLLGRCSVVVGSAGGNVVAEVAAARKPYVCLPQPRPFDEQNRQADAVERLGVAEIRRIWPEAAEWPALLAAAEGRPTERWAELHDGEGGRRLAAVVRTVGGGG